LFTPLLASTTVGTLEFRCITEPVRDLKNTYYSASVDSIDLEKKSLTFHDKEFSYDKLFIAVGAVSNTFGTQGVYEHANFLRDIKI
jgi:NADH dehydrogenase FAD-containing subunit